jgi:carbohydrate kinase (thermoresistant glucokinase family)
MIIIVWGVAGSGKTTVGQALAAGMPCPYFDADDFHPAANIKKMASGQPLTDVDRLPWLKQLREIVDAHDSEKSAVLACSALTAAYRSILGFGLPHVRSVLLDGPESLIVRRLKMRKDHFMPTSLLHSQIALLEPEHDGLTLNIEQAPSVLVQAIQRWLQSEEHANSNNS